MIIKKKSPATGKINARDIDITEEQLARYNEGVELIQNIAPHLSADDREFLMTGYTPEDWDNMFGEEE